jgi:hypothetical protein
MVTYAGTYSPNRTEGSVFIHPSGNLQIRSSGQRASTKKEGSHVTPRGGAGYGCKASIEKQKTGSVESMEEVRNRANQGRKREKTKKECGDQTTISAPVTAETGLRQEETGESLKEQNVQQKRYVWLLLQLTIVVVLKGLLAILLLLLELVDEALQRVLATVPEALEKAKRDCRSETKVKRRMRRKRKKAARKLSQKILTDPTIMDSPKPSHSTYPSLPVESSLDLTDSPSTGAVATPSTRAETPSNPLSDAKEPSIPMTSSMYPLGIRMPLPRPGSAEAPMFDGNNISNFLKEYSEMCEDYGLTPEAKRERLVRYVAVGYKDEIERMSSFCAEDYSEKAFYDELRTEYAERDWEAVRVSLDYLLSITSQAARGELSSKHFVTTFDSVSRVLIQKGALTETLRCREFVKGVTPSVRARIFKKTSYNALDVEPNHYKEMLEIAKADYKSTERIRKYEEATDPNISRFRRETIGAVIKENAPKKLNEYYVPTPPAAPSAKQPPAATYSRTEVEKEPEQEAKTKSQKGKKKQEEKANEVDLLTEQVKALTISNAGIEKMMGQLLERTDKERSQQPYSSVQQQNQGKGLRGGYQAQAMPTQKSIPTEIIQGNVCHVVSADRAGRPNSDRMCYGCFGRDVDNNPVLNSTHVFSNACPLLTELINRGCAHKSSTTGQLCKGPWELGKTSVPFFLRSDQRWFDQIRMSCLGGPFDYNILDRPGNIKRLQRDTEVAEEARGEHRGSDANMVQTNPGLVYGEVEILRREPDEESICLDGCYNGAGTPDGKDLLDYYDALPNELASVNAVATTRRKAALAKEAENAIRRRARKEEKYPQAKSQRTVTLEPEIQQGEAEDMNVDLGEQSEEELQVEDERAVVAVSEDEEEQPTPRRKKATAPLPKISRNTRAVLDAFKTPNPAATLRNQFLRDNSAYLMVIKAAASIAEEMSTSAQEGVFLKSLERLAVPKAINNPVLLNANAGGVISYQELLVQKNIITSPRIHFRLKGPLGSWAQNGVIDTGAEINILRTDTARRLGAVIRSIETFALSTATGHTFAFAGMTTLRVEIADGVGCDIAFFLVDGAPKILLGQPFVGRMKMSLLYRDDGSWDGVFTDPRNTQSKCTIMVIPPLKKLPQQTDNPAQEAADEPGSDSESEN